MSTAAEIELTELRRRCTAVVAAFRAMIDQAGFVGLADSFSGVDVYEIRPLELAIDDIANLLPKQPT